MNASLIRWIAILPMLSALVHALLIGIVRAKISASSIWVISLSSLLSQANRERALNAFRKGECQILVATDVAARGIDILDIDLVVNFDVPMHAEDYVHRIGRTGRAERSGKAATLVCELDGRARHRRSVRRG